MPRWGASPSDWDHLTLGLGLDTELLPVVSNPKAVIAPGSTLKSIGKVPSVYDRANHVVGLAGWTRRRSVEYDIKRWRSNPDYGICLQCRTVRALDLDLSDTAMVAEIQGLALDMLDVILPVRSRSNSPKMLLAFRLAGVHTKSVIKTAAGAIEFLADGQQFIAVGTHTSGVPYTWPGGLPSEFPDIEPGAWAAFWEALTARFAVPGSRALTARSGPGRGSQVVKAAERDPIAKYLVENEWFISTNRDGSLNIKCPNEGEHTTNLAGGGAESATTYFPAHTGGFAQGHFKCLHAHCAEKTDSDFLTLCGYYASQFDVIDGRAPEEPMAEIEAEVVFARGGASNNILATLANLRIALSSDKITGGRIVYDKFRDEMQVVLDGEAPRPLKDSDPVNLRERFERKIGFNPIGKEMMRDALLAHKDRNTIDSAQAWLGRQVWDGVSRVETFALRYLGTADSPYTRAVGLYIWTALAGRCMQPGCEASMVPVLIGPQGQGKTRAVKALAPTPDQYAELALDVRDHDLARAMRGKLVGELGELRGLGTRDSDAIKAWLSRTFDEWTPKYVEYTTKYLRRIVFFGTTNEEQFLQDDTGERRWLPLVTGEIDVEAIERDRDQLWAEGLELWLGGGVQYRVAEGLAVDVHGEHKITEPWDAIIEKWLGEEEFGDGVEGVKRNSQFFTITDVMKSALDLKSQNITRREEMRAAKCLKRLGYIKQRFMHQGIQMTFWGTSQVFARSGPKK